MSDPLKKDWIASGEAALMMGVRPAYLYRLVYLGVLTPTKVNRSILFRIRDIERYIETHPRLGRKSQVAA